MEGGSISRYYSLDSLLARPSNLKEAPVTQQIPPMVGRTRHTELTLDQIAEMQPGLGALMPQVSDRYWILYYAAKGGNWPLARHQLSEIRGLLRLGATTRPRYADYLNDFINGPLSALEKALGQQDIPAFEAAFQKGIEGANHYHQVTGHPEIVWQLPLDSPKHLSLKPPPQGANP
jgi:hypothetical protein